MKTVQALLLLVLSVLVATEASAAELKIFGSRVTQVVVGELASQFEKATGFKPVVVADVAAVMKRRAESGEAFDMAVLVQFQIDDLIKSGKLIADSRADISTVAAFKETLLKAKSVIYLKEGGSTIQLRKIFDQFGITEQITAKAVETTGEQVAERVASGEVELGLIVAPNILTVPGAELVGELPAEINSIVMFTAGVSAASPNQQAARELIKLLTTPEVKALIKARGNNPA